MKLLLKRLLISGLLTGLFYVAMTLQHQRTEHEINLATVACAIVCVIYSLIWE